MERKPFWKWLLIFIAGCILFLISYVVIPVPSALKMPLWAFALACVAVSALNLLLYAGWWKLTEKRRAQDLPMQRDVESQLAAYHLYRNHLTEARRC